MLALSLVLHTMFNAQTLVFRLEPKQVNPKVSHIGSTALLFILAILTEGTLPRINEHSESQGFEGFAETWRSGKTGSNNVCCWELYSTNSMGCWDIS